MRTLLAAVQWGDIAEVLWVAPLAGIGVTVLFSMGLYGSTKAAEAGRDKRSTDATLFGALAAVSFLGFAAAIVFGVFVIIDK